jgi:hypothetical protein
LFGLFPGGTCTTPDALDDVRALQSPEVHPGESWPWKAKAAARELLMNDFFRRNGYIYRNEAKYI